jgi:hypothetical protein
MIYHILRKRTLLRYTITCLGPLKRTDVHGHIVTTLYVREEIEATMVHLLASDRTPEPAGVVPRRTWRSIGWICYDCKKHVPHILNKPRYSKYSVEVCCVCGKPLKGEAVGRRQCQMHGFVELCHTGCVGLAP